MLRNNYFFAPFLCAISIVTSASAQQAGGIIIPDAKVGTHTLERIVTCQRGELAFAGSCRSAEYFAELAAPGWTPIEVMGCQKLADDCSQTVILSESDDQGGVRLLGLAGSSKLSEVLEAEQGGIRPFKKPKQKRGGNVEAGGISGIEQQGSNVRRSRGGHPVIFRNVSRSSANDATLTIDSRITHFDPPGRKPSLVFSSEMVLGPAIVRETGWSRSVEVSFCSEDGLWPESETDWTDCSASGKPCFFSRLLCNDSDVKTIQPELIRDRAKDLKKHMNKNPLTRGTRLGPLDAQQSTGNDIEQNSGTVTASEENPEKCSVAHSPVLGVEFGAVFEGEGGLLCRVGDGGISTTDALALGAPISSWEPNVCGALYDTAMMHASVNCDVLSRTGAGLEGFWDAAEDKKVSVKFSKSGPTIGFDGTLGETFDDIPTPGETGERLARNKALCAAYVAHNINALMSQAGCIDGYCQGTHFGMAVEVSFKIEDTTWICDAKADAVCGSATANGEPASFGDEECTCSAINEITWDDIDIDSCRIAG